MQLRRYDQVDDFLEAATPFLVVREAEHNLIFGVAATLREDPDQYMGPPYLAVVSDGDRVVAAAIQTPPWRVVLSEIDDPTAIDVLVDDLVVRDVPGVQGATEVVGAFIEAWSAHGGRPAHHHLATRIYRLTEVLPTRPVPGARRDPVPGDRDRLVEWMWAFGFEALGEDDREGAADSVDNWLARRARVLHVWADGDEIVSVCGVTGPTPNGIRIGPVYTPPERRGHGYASALVAAVSQAQLDAGRRFCFLFTDLANPTANRIYQAIGYRPVRDFAAFDFDPR